jgi:hypothetical protein
MGEPWFTKSILATLSIVPAFLAIPFMRRNYGVDPLVFVVWYFGGTAVSIAAYLALSRGTAVLVPHAAIVAAIVALGLAFGALANGSLFQAVGLAPNPGLPPVIYASSSVVIFMLAALFARALPGWFSPVSTDPSRLLGLLLVLGGLYLLAGGRIGRAVA